MSKELGNTKWAGGSASAPRLHLHRQAGRRWHWEGREMQLRKKDMWICAAVDWLQQPKLAHESGRLGARHGCWRQMLAAGASSGCWHVPVFCAGRHWCGASTSYCRHRRSRKGCWQPGGRGCSPVQRPSQLATSVANSSCRCLLVRSHSLHLQGLQVTAIIKNNV